MFSKGGYPLVTNKINFLLLLLNFNYIKQICFYFLGFSKIRKGRFFFGKIDY